MYWLIICNIACDIYYDIILQYRISISYCNIAVILHSFQRHRTTNAHIWQPLQFSWLGKLLVIEENYWSACAHVEDKVLARSFVRANERCIVAGVGAYRQRYRVQYHMRYCECQEWSERKMDFAKCKVRFFSKRGSLAPDIAHDIAYLLNKRHTISHAISYLV